MTKSIRVNVSLKEEINRKYVFQCPVCEEDRELWLNGINRKEIWCPECHAVLNLLPRRE
jgi:transposase